jgi:hypothetical protein
MAPAKPLLPEPRAKPKRQRQKLPGPWRLSDAKGDGKYRFIEGKVGTDSFLKALEAAGAPEAQGYRVLAAMRGVLDLDKCKKTDRFQALLERGSNKLFALEYLAGPEDVYQAKATDGRLTGSKLDLKIERGQVLGALSYDGSSFDHSADVAGFDPGLAKVVARALDGHMSLDELDRGDVIRLVAQEVTVLGEFTRYAGVEALELIRVDPKKTHLRIYYSDAPGVRGYYDRDGKAPFEGGWRKPIKDAPRTSPFNPHRVNPVLHKVMPHQGTDFGSPRRHADRCGFVRHGELSGTGWPRRQPGEGDAPRRYRDRLRAYVALRRRLEGRRQGEASATARLCRQHRPLDGATPALQR